MLDLILVVNDPVKFHKRNLKINSSHYSALKYLGARSLAAVQDHWAARVYFNTLVPHNNGLLKYGVVSTAALETDLLDWEWMYVSGRLHKPVLPLQLPQSPSLRSALQVNLQSAVHAALLLLPEEFDEQTLYLTLTGLSYTGDFRMTFGEDRDKVINIVLPQVERFRELYAPLWPGLSQWAEFNVGTKKCDQDCSPTARLFHLNLLPKRIQNMVTMKNANLLNIRDTISGLHFLVDTGAEETIVRQWIRDGRWRDVEDVLRAIAYDTECPHVVQEAVQKTVGASSWSQALKGVATAGVFKSVRYGGAKVAKWWKSSRRTSS